MNESMVSKNYLFGAKLSLLIMSFLILVIGITVQNDIWPFIQTNLPSQNSYPNSFFIGFLISVILPGVWLVCDWEQLAVRYALISLLGMLLVQEITQAIVSHYFFRSMVVPTCMLYGGYRLVQLAQLQRLIFRMGLSRARMLRGIIVWSNIIFWSIVWIKLTFITFPQIIYQIW